MATTFRRTQGDESVEITFLDKNLGLKVETTNTKKGWLEFFEKRNNNVCFPVTCKGGIWRNCVPLLDRTVVKQEYKAYCKRVATTLINKMAQDNTSKLFTIIEEENANGDSKISLKTDNIGKEEIIFEDNIKGYWQDLVYLKNSLVQIGNMFNIRTTKVLPLDESPAATKIVNKFNLRTKS